MSKKIGLLIVFFSLFFLFSISAEAIPKLGVIDTGLLATSGGTTPVGMDGFLFPSDGKITVWWGSDSGSVDLDVHVWIATTAGSGRTFTYDSTTVTLNTVIDDKVDGYTGPPYWAADLGSVNSNPYWTPAAAGTAPDLSSGEKMEFYLLSGVFGGPLATYDWIFAVGDLNKNAHVFDSGTDKFSPKTTSTVVPEPSTLLLLGAGLIGCGIFGRRKFRS
jgi:hypothetical protein